MILDPFTSWFLGLLGINPFWVLYIGTILAIVGLVLYRTDKTITIGLVASLVKTLTDKRPTSYSIAISPGTARLAGSILIVLGIILVTPATDALASTNSSTLYLYGSGGGPTQYHCSDWFNIICWTGGSATGNSTLLCTSTASSNCPAATNACNRFTNTTACSGINEAQTATFGPQTTVENLAFNGQYCTGITSNPLTLKTTNPNLLVSGYYSFSDQNVTNAGFNIIVDLSTAVPSTSFQANPCASALGFGSVVCQTVSALAVGKTLHGSCAVPMNPTVTAGSVIYGFVVIQETFPTQDVQIKTGIANKVNQGVLLQEQT